MLRRLVIALDHTEHGQAAQEYALALAAAHKASILAVAILDTPWLTASQAEPLGGLAFKIQRDDVVLQKTQEHLEELITHFKARAEAVGVACEILKTEGFPAIEIQHASYQGDLIIMGKTTDFHFELEEETDMTVRQIARENPRPLLAIPQGAVMGDKILVAYDGYSHSSRALHLFLLLGLAKGCTVEIFTIGDDQQEIDLALDEASKLCAAHNVKATTRGLFSKDDPGALLLTHIVETKPSMVVMGAFRQAILTEALFGSCTKTLMHRAPVPLFISH